MAKNPITHIKDHEQDMSLGGRRGALCGVYYDDDLGERWDDDNPTCKSCRRSSWRRGGNRISPTAKRPITHIKDRDPEAIFTDPGGLRKGMCGAVYGDECYERWDDNNPSCSKCIRYQNSKARLRKLRRRFRLAAKKAR